MKTDELRFDDRDGQEVVVRIWAPDAEPNAVVQIAHGAVEHGARYERFAQALTDAGMAVCAPDHRGHGLTAGSIERAGQTGPDGWSAIVDAFVHLTGMIEETHPGLPIVVLGHSMGSIVVQQYLQTEASRVAAAILSGSFGTLGETEPLLAAIDAEIEANGPTAGSQTFGGMFVAFNEPFDGPDATGFEWLSRDQAEVQAYVDDPWSGSFEFSNEFVRAFVVGMEEIWRPEHEGRLPTDLPILISSGDQDPAGGMGATTGVLVDRYRALGLDLTVMMYEGARHELLNETNRDQVMADWVGWIQERLAG
ncbi:MAG: alpha/beta hydrolase [Actinomycetota bacterium]